MGAHLDLDDVVAGHPKAAEELATLLAENERLRELGRELLTAVLDDHPTVKFITVAGAGIHIDVNAARALLEGREK